MLKGLDTTVAFGQRQTYQDESGRSDRMADLAADYMSPANDRRGQSVLQEIRYTAPRGVTDAIGSLGRTEDVRFSPSNRRLALAAFNRNLIAVFNIDIVSCPGGPQVALTGGVTLSSAALQKPHGLDFINDDTVIVTNREGDVALFRLPPGEPSVPCHEVPPLVRWSAGATTLLNAPGSVSVARAADEDDVYEILICNNAGHSVSRHLLDWNAPDLVRQSNVLLKKHLDIPDGVSVSPDRRWIAVSNHNTHNVLLYENSPALNPDAEPDGILRRVYYPHGVSFSANGRYLFVADAGAPYLHIYAQSPDEWRGVRHPIATVRIMDDAVFRRGRYNPREGGPKGLDVDAGSIVLVVTSEYQRLAFFDVPKLLENALAGSAGGEQRFLDINYELSLMREAATKTTEVKAWVAQANALRNSRSWRMTAPLRKLSSIFR